MSKKVIDWEKFKENIKPSDRRFCTIANNACYNNITADGVYEIVQESNIHYWVIDNRGTYQKIDKAHAIPIKSSILSLSRLIKRI